MEDQPIATQQSITNPEPVITPLITPPKSSHLIPIILSSLITAIILVGSYYLLLSKKTDSVSTPSPSETTSNNVKMDPTADWKTYDNTTLKIQLKHPNDWTVKGFAGDQENFDKTENTFSRFTIKSPDDLISFTITNSVFEGSLDPCMSEQKPASTESLDGNIFARSTYTSKCPETDVKFISLSSTDKNMSLTFNYSNANQVEAEKIFNQILSTFKFTNKNSSIPVEINKIFTAINQDLDMNITPTREAEFYSLQGFVKKESWKFNFVNLPTDKSKTTQLYKILDQYLKQDINNTADGVGQSVQGYENDQIYCFLLRGFNQSDYLSCILK